jgi:hypothetical protein
VRGLREVDGLGRDAGCGSSGLYYATGPDGEREARTYLPAGTTMTITGDRPVLRVEYVGERPLPTVRDEGDRVTCVFTCRIVVLRPDAAWIANAPR